MGVAQVVRICTIQGPLAAPNFNSNKMHSLTLRHTGSIVRGRVAVPLGANLRSLGDPVFSVVCVVV